MTRRLLSAAVGATLLAAAPVQAHADGVRRFALLAGANDGGAERVPLIYAGSDARTMSSVLARYGGVSSADTLVLEDPDRAALERGFVELKRRIASASGGASRVEVVVYYSGHSDARGLLLLGGERVPYRDLRGLLDDLDADVRVAILDSCSSGALVRGKGGVAVQGFLTEDGSDVEGHAFLTSSSADEVSQEADALGGSFFTHALVTGLRGGADTDLDGQVTLNEAYRFAYDETLARTEGTRFGPQHAAFDIQLSGSGDLVMTDLRQRRSSLEIGSEIGGLIMVRDQSGRLVAELRKPAGRPVQLRLDPGDYTVTAREPNGTLRTRVRVGSGAPATVERNDLQGFAMLDTRTRGGEPAALAGSAAVREAPTRVVGFDTTLLGDWQRDLPHDEVKASVGLLATRSWRIDGTAMALGATFAETGGHGVQMSMGFNAAGEELTGAQLTIGANLMEGETTGLQAAVGANLHDGPLRGAQLAVGGNWAERADGVQFAVGANLVQEDFGGLQFAPGANVVGGHGKALQLSAGANIAETLDGAQISAAYNHAGTLHGTQLGLINVSGGDDDRGFKLGLINVSGKLKGGTVGLVNAAESVEGVPLGFVNIIDNGIRDIEFWGDTSGGFLGGLKTGSNHFYTLLALGWADATVSDGYGDSSLLAGGLALGGRFNSGKGERLPVDLDAGVWYHSDFSSAVISPKIRGAGGLRITKNFTPFVGMELAVPIAIGQGAAVESLLGTNATDGRVSVAPGFFAGVRF